MLKTQNYKSKISLNVVSISSTSFCVNAENSFFRERTESFPFPCSKNPTSREIILSGISNLLSMNRLNASNFFKYSTSFGITLIKVSLTQ